MYLVLSASRDAKCFWFVKTTCFVLFLESKNKIPGLQKCYLQLSTMLQFATNSKFTILRNVKTFKNLRITCSGRRDYDNICIISTVSCTTATVSNDNCQNNQREQRWKDSSNSVTRIVVPVWNNFNVGIQNSKDKLVVLRCDLQCCIHGATSICYLIHTYHISHVHTP